jgi:hypothetical protein
MKTPLMAIGMSVAASFLLALVPATAESQASGTQPDTRMGFFVTSVGLGDGANLGGLDGADRHCQALAGAVGAGGRTWRAYLSQAPAGGLPQVNARDRIGNGPWYNANGARIAWDVADLHGDHQRDSNNIRKPTAVDERGELILGVGDSPNQHDILTGSDSHGRLPPGNAAVTTCSNWTSNAAEGRALVGHHDRLGGANASWNSVHMSNGCGQENLVATGGAGFFYCFASDPQP